MMAPVTLSTFQMHLGEPFAVHLDRGTCLLSLIEASSLVRNGAAGGIRAPFQLKFAGPGPQCLAQRTYELKNERLGSLEAFLVPVGRNGEGFFYQAVFT